MHTKIVFAVLLTAPLLLLGQTPAVHTKPQISIKAEPSENVPKGDCKQDESGYLEKSDGTGTNHYIQMDPAEIGNYVINRTKHGYVVTLYPQVSGKIWASAECRSK